MAQLSDPSLQGTPWSSPTAAAVLMNAKCTMCAGHRFDQRAGADEAARRAHEGGGVQSTRCAVCYREFPSSCALWRMHRPWVIRPGMRHPVPLLPASLEAVLTMKRLLTVMEAVCKTGIVRNHQVRLHIDAAGQDRLGLSGRTSGRHAITGSMSAFSSAPHALAAFCCCRSRSVCDGRSSARPCSRTHTRSRR